MKDWIARTMFDSLRGTHTVGFQVNYSAQSGWWGHTSTEPDDGGQRYSSVFYVKQCFSMSSWVKHYCYLLRNSKTGAHMLYNVFEVTMLVRIVPESIPMSVWLQSLISRTWILLWFYSRLVLSGCTPRNWNTSCESLALKRILKRRTENSQ